MSRFKRKTHRDKDAGLAGFGCNGASIPLSDTDNQARICRLARRCGRI